MAGALKVLERKFRYGGMDLPDPDSTMKVEEVLRHYSRSYAKLVGGKVVSPIQEGDCLIYELKENFGDNG